ncbi:MAG TPA: RDD family protein [Ornithinibacter sp.]|nr:RDD family protein [Ornithinibacter sp.]
MSELPAGPGWYEDEHDPLLLRYFDGVVWTSHTTPRRSPTADASTIGRATPGVIPGRAGNPGAWAQPGQQGPQAPQGPGQWQGGGAPPTDYNPYQQGWVGARNDVLPDGAVLAEWWRRLVGRILDLIVITVLTLVFALPWLGTAVSAMSDYMQAVQLAAESGGPQPDQTAFTEQILSVSVPIALVSVLVSLVYQTIFLTTRGATPGKMVVGTVVRRVGHPGKLTVVDALKRQAIDAVTTLLSLVPLLGLFAPLVRFLDPVWLLWDPKRQALHDKVADTVVVLRNPQQR